MDALALIEKPGTVKPQPIFVLAGDESFLKREARAVLESQLLGDADPGLAVAPFEGQDLRWSAVKSELDTLPFCCPMRIVIVDQADPFVSDNRTQLEKYVGAPSKSGVLILEVKSWPSNTRLAKLVPDSATIVCKPPHASKVSPWLVQRTKTTHGKELPKDVAEMLIEYVGPELGKLDQELTKLSASTSEKKITRELVDQLVGRSRAAETFKIFDRIGEGNSAAALSILARLFQQGEAPQQILGAFSWQMRRLAKVSRGVRAGLTVQAAFDRAGVPPFARQSVETQLRHIGKERMDKIYDWLLAADLAMKSTVRDERLILERLVVQLGMAG